MRRFTFHSLLALCLLLTISGAALARAHGCLTECSPRFGIVSAFAHVAFANQIPFIAFRGLSDLAGGSDFNDVDAFFGSGLAEANSAAVTLAFLTAWASQPGH